MGMVYKARQTRLDRFVALKILPLDLARDPSFAERFNREARALARLNHPGIITVYDFGQTSQYYYFVMEFVDGVNLRQLLASGTVEPRQALDLVVQICTALQVAHDQGVVHRDIKPENLLISKKGQVKIADFGIAKLLGAARDTTLTMPRSAMGTFNYMAPEQRENAQKVDHRADIFSLGVVFYEMLTGELPVGRFAPPSQKVQVDVRLDEVVLRTLEKEPERRYQHASEVRTSVENLQAHGSPADPKILPALSAPATPEKVPKRAVLAAALTGLSLGLVALGAACMGAKYFVQLILLQWAALLMAILAVPPALAGILLGVLVLIDFRMSGGPKRVLPLALFAVLPWPLLVVDGLIVYQVYQEDSQGIALAGMIALCLILDGSVAYELWRNLGATKPKANDKAVAAPSPPES
jgi:predicted Ser/Thr protein kinase